MTGVAFERARAVCERAARGEVLVSRTVTDLVAGSGVAFLDRGAHPLAVGDDAWSLFAVTGAGETAARGLSPQSAARPQAPARRIQPPPFSPVGPLDRAAVLPAGPVAG